MEDHGLPEIDRSKTEIERQLQDGIIRHASAGLTTYSKSRQVMAWHQNGLGSERLLTLRLPGKRPRGVLLLGPLSSLVHQYDCARNRVQGW